MALATNGKSLLQKQFKAFTLYALLVLVCSIPAYFFIVDRIWLNELDEHNLIVAQQLRSGLENKVSDEASLLQFLALWNAVQPGNRIAPAPAHDGGKDSTYEVTHKTPGTEADRFRGLSTLVHIHGKAYRLTVETNVEESSETILAIALITIFFVLVLVCGFIVLNRKLSRSVWRPFYDTLEKLHAFELGGQAQAQFDATSIREFTELHAALEKLLDRNRTMYQEQKQFTENAAHELQTPLAIMQSKLDMLLQHETLSGSQYQLIEDLLKALARISRINRNLLLLARLENRQFGDAAQVELAAMAEETLALLHEIMLEKQLTLQTHIDSGVTVTANVTLVEVLLSNLFFNAVRHTQQGGAILIVLSSSQLVVRNSGAAPLQEKNLFRRFSTVSPGTPGSGLGLAIIRQVCEHCGWHVAYTYEAGVHVFSVDLAGGR